MILELRFLHPVLRIPLNGLIDYQIIQYLLDINYLNSNIISKLI
jgi:hypothetical protein